MSCNIIINTAQLIGFANSNPTQIQVKGSATECDEIEVKILCHGNPFTGLTRVATDGTWEITMQIPIDAGCRCGRKVTIKASNTANVNCSATYDDSIDCKPPSGCPDILEISFEFLECVMDEVSGINKRKVRFTPNIIGTPPDPVAHIWLWGDGSDSFKLGKPEEELHDYAARPNSLPRLKIIGPEPCEETFKDVSNSFLDNFQPCECPLIADVDVIIGDCINDNGTKKRSVKFIPSITGPTPDAYSWTFGDGSPNEVGAGMPTAVDHLYENRPENEPVLQIIGPRPCPNKSKSVVLSEFENFDPCESRFPPSSIPPATFDEGGLCKGLRWSGIILTILSILALYICTCLGNTTFCWISLGLAIGAAVILAIWFIFCPRKPCNYLTLFAWQIALGAGIGAMYFINCCPWLLTLGMILITLGFLLLVRWAISCNKSLCQIMGELAIVITVIIIPVLDWLGVIPELMLCINPVVRATVATMSAVIAVVLALCTSRSS